MAADCDSSPAGRPAADPERPAVGSLTAAVLGWFAPLSLSADLAPRPRRSPAGLPRSWQALSARRPPGVPGDYRHHPVATALNTVFGSLFAVVLVCHRSGADAGRWPGGPSVRRLPIIAGLMLVILQAAGGIGRWAGVGCPGQPTPGLGWRSRLQPVTSRSSSARSFRSSGSSGRAGGGFTPSARGRWTTFSYARVTLPSVRWGLFGRRDLPDAGPGRSASSGRCCWSSPATPRPDPDRHPVRPRRDRRESFNSKPTPPASCWPAFRSSC